MIQRRRSTQLYQNHITLCHKIGRGGFATVYHATAQEDDRPLAVKIANHSPAQTGMNESIEKEAELLSRFEHPGIVQLHPLPPIPGKSKTVFSANASMLQGNPSFFAMELLAGGTLQAYLKRVGKLPEAEAATVLIKLCRALRHIHRRGVAHSDLKPENILFRRPIVSGQPFDPVLIDFGIATKVRALTTRGTIHMLAPEQLSDVRSETLSETQIFKLCAGEIDKEKIDVWGLGAVAFYLLSGKHPFRALRNRSTLARILHEEPGPIEGIDQKLADLIIKGCLAKDPRSRVTVKLLEIALMELYDRETPASRAGSDLRTPWIGRLFG